MLSFFSYDTLRFVFPAPMTPPIVHQGGSFANVRAAARKLPAELLEKLDAATAELKEAMGGNCDLWQGLHEDGRFDGRIK